MHYIITVTDRSALTLCIEAKDTDEAREQAQELLDSGTPEFMTDYFAPADYLIDDDIIENPEPNEAERKNAVDNADALAEMTD